MLIYIYPNVCHFVSHSCCLFPTSNGCCFLKFLFCHCCSCWYLVVHFKERTLFAWSSIQRSDSWQSFRFVVLFKLWSGFLPTSVFFLVIFMVIFASFLVIVSLFSVFFFFFWHHFVYFEKRQKNQNKYRVNAKYAIVPFYTDGYDFLLVLNGMKPVILKCFFRCSGSDILGWCLCDGLKFNTLYLELS